MGHDVTVALVATLLLAGAPASPPELEPARDALRRHDYARAAQLLQVLADGGNAEASYQLGLLYLPRSNDIGLPPDPPRACRLLLQAAGAGHAKAANSLAAQAELGVCKDTGKSAAEWSALATASGYAGARGTQSAAPSAAAEDPATLLKRAARDGDGATLERLLETVPAALASADRRTALHEAADGQKADAARLLLDHGAVVDARDVAGDTPLLVAARRGAAPVIAVLLDAKADSNAVDVRGGTPLMLAAAALSPPAVELLLAHGADPQLRNKQGLSALDLAERAGKNPAATEIAATLRTRGATRPWRARRVPHANCAATTCSSAGRRRWSPLSAATCPRSRRRSPPAATSMPPTPAASRR